MEFANNGQNIRGYAMKMDAAMVEKTLNQFEAQAIPDEHPAVPQLNKVFGDHTFFLNDDGLHIIEPAADRQDGSETGKIVRLASWNDANHTSLAPHEPETSEATVDLGDRS
ncbi:MAG TPA: hypothetical protein VM755_05640 [Stellaceae bacterium]|nr:hypothetical protein [Stellaceae bacterium]